MGYIKDGVKAEVYDWKITGFGMGGHINVGKGSDRSLAWPSP